jgi:hypothetical protein
VESVLGVVDSLATNVLGYARSIEEKIDYPKDKRIPVGIITGFLGSGTFLQPRRTSHPKAGCRLVSPSFARHRQDDAPQLRPERQPRQTDCGDRKRVRRYASFPR